MSTQTEMVTTVTTLASIGANPVTCSVEGCDRDRVARGLCLLHYRRLRRHGDTDGGAGRKIIDEKTLVVNQLFSDWSSRTRERYIRAWRLLELAGVDIRTVIPSVTRPSRSLNVTELLRIAETRVACAIADGSLSLGDES